jgi:putative ABC transport system permease protein
MLSVSLKSLLAHRRRLIGTFLAVFLGVAFLAGTLVMGDTLRANFDVLFGNANAGTDAVVRATRSIEADVDRGPSMQERALIDASLLDRLRPVDGVAAAEPSVEGYGQLQGRDGEALGGNGPPRIAANWIDNATLNPYRLVDGRAPRTDNEVVINRGTAEEGHLAVGDTTVVQTPEPVRVRIVGIATFGDADGQGRLTYTAFTLAGAERYITMQPGKVSSIVIQAEPGVSQEDVVRRIEPLLPSGVEALTGAERTEQMVNDVSGEFLDLFRTILVVFAGIALLVATFSIHNTFSILAAQRTRESALLRAVGASRGQILASMVVEAAVLGVLASVTGFAGGLGVAMLLKTLFSTFGFALPASGLEVTGTAAVVSIAAGITVTLLAGVLPAVRASRVPPLAALRDVAFERSSGLVGRAIVGLGLGGVGVALVLWAVLAGGDATLVLAGVGAIVTVCGVVVFGPVVARSAGRIIGAPLPALRGVTGALARENATRNPRRTSSTAAALMVGVGVVTLFTVFAASLRTSIDRSVETSFGGDLTISAGSFGGGGMSPRLASDVDRLPEVQEATGIAQGAATVDGEGQVVNAGDPATLSDMLDLGVVEGSIGGLGERDLAVSEQVADDRGWQVGTVVPVAFADGARSDFTVGAIYAERRVLGDYVMERAAWEPHAVQRIDWLVLVTLRDGVSLADGRAAVERVAGAYGSPAVQDRAEYAESLGQGVDIMLGVVYVLLALAIIIALMGIANTLSLSVYERTRELGLLRAVGQTRGQLRSMVRWESVIIAVFGTVGGLGLGVFLGWALVRASSPDGLAPFTVPGGQLGIVLAAGAAAGVLAGLRPARRAARLDVLRAVAAE